MINLVDVGKKISYYRRLNNMSQDYLGEKLFVTRQLISKWEVGNGTPTIDSIIEITKLFNVSFEDLLCLGFDVEKAKKDDPLYGYNQNLLFKNLKNKNIELKDISYRIDLLGEFEKKDIISLIKKKKIDVDMDLLIPYLNKDEIKYLKGE